MRFFRFLAAATVAAASLAAWSVSPDASAGASVSIGKIVIDASPAGVPVAGAPIKFTVKARMNGSEEGENPWVAVKIDFKDASEANSGFMFGAGVQTYETTHTFADEGTYLVTATAYHGFKGDGYKYYRVAKLKVVVACAGTDLGPKTCPRPSYQAWAGEWKVKSVFSNPEAPSIVLGQITSVSFTQLGDEVVGTLRIDRGVGDVTMVNFHGTETPIFKGSKSAIQIKGKHDAVDADKKTKHTFSMSLATDPDGLNSYRIGGAHFDNIKLVNEGVAKFTEFTFEPVSKPSSANTAAICTILGAGQKKTKPGNLVTFAVQVVNVGPGCLPAGRIGVNLFIEGATTGDLFVKGTGFSVGSVADHDVVLLSNALGVGRGRATQRIIILVAAKVDVGATEVRCTVTASDQRAATDTLVSTNLPTQRFVCIPVAE